MNLIRSEEYAPVNYVTLINAVEALPRIGQMP